VYLIEVSEKIKNGVEIVFKETMAENFPDLIQVNQCLDPKSLTK
jgi:hypothetical protein